MIFEHLLVAIGLIALLSSIHPTLLMIRKLPKGSTLTLWKILLGLIVFFVIGYIIVLFLLSSISGSVLKNALVYMLLGGGLFVWIITRVSVDSIDILERLVILERQSTRDSLMNIYNRRYLDTRIGEEFSRARRYKKDLTFMMLDVDHFKNVNDQFGHDVGDKVLTELANILKSVVRDSDIIARYGGEEIAIICPHTEQKGAEILAKRLCKAVDERLSISLSNLAVVNGTNKDNQIHNITVSIGGCCLNDGFQDAFALIKHADKALYRAKDAGRNRVIMAC